MDISQLKTFVGVAREGSVTRASETLHLSQPAVSAQIKALEDTLGLALFERTPRGMSLTPEGERLLAKAQQILAMHQEILDDATRSKGRIAGKLRVGAGSNTTHEAVGKLLAVMSQRHPDVEVILRHGTSAEILAGIRNGSLDGGFYNEADDPDLDLSTIEVSRFSIALAAAPGLVPLSDPPDWRALGDMSWIYPAASACCGRTAEALFKAHRFRPKRVISSDREEITRTLIASGIGVGLLHAETAKRSEKAGEVQLLFQSPKSVRTLFAILSNRTTDPLLIAATSILGEGSTPPPPR